MVSGAQPNDVSDWLRSIGMDQYVELFAEHKIDPEALAELSDLDLREMAIPLGHRKRILKHIRKAAVQRVGEPANREIGVDASLGITRHLTILVVDLVESTALSGSLDKEELTAVLRAFHAACESTVRRVGGYVARYRGDGLLAFFGWPDAHEDNAERAAAAGLALIGAAKGVSSPAGLPLRIRVGIATGHVIVTSLKGADQAPVYEAFGQVPNLAARLEAAASADTVLISEATHELISAKFQSAALGERALKGFDRPVRIYQVQRMRTMAVSFEARRAGGLTTLIGRAKELKIMREGWSRAQTVGGQVLILSGEPGIGKSRLLAELHQTIDAATEPLFMQCSPLHTESPLYPVFRCLGALAGFDTDVASSDRLRTLVSTVESKLGQRDGTEYFLASLFGIEVPVSDPDAFMSPAARREQALHLLADYVCQYAAPKTGLVLFEDAHWMDPTTTRFLDILIGRATSARLLLVITHRTQFKPPWQEGGHLKAFHLGRLPPKQGLAMVDAMTAHTPLPEALKSRIAQRSDGNPFYLEELASAVLGAAAPVGFRSDGRNQASLLTEIPATLQDSLHARIGRLTAASREFAQMCSVAGRSFSADLICAISTTMPAAAEHLLSELMEAGVLRAQPSPTGVEYAFRHALIQDAVYSTLLRDQRRRLHGQCAIALEKRFASLCTNEPELLAHHWESAGDIDAAIPYYLAAGQRAFERAALAEADTYLQKGLALIQTLPAAEMNRSAELTFRDVLSRVYMLAKGWADPSVHAQISRALELCADDDEKRRVPFEWGLATYHLLRGEISDAVSAGDRVIGIAEHLGDEGALTVAHSAACIFSFYAGRFAQVIGHVDRTQVYYRPQMSEQTRLFYGTDRRLQALRAGALAYWCLGNHARAWELDEEQREVVRNTDRIYEYTYALTISCILHSLRRDAGEMLRHAEAAIGPGRDRGFVFLKMNAENFQALGRALKDPSPQTLQSCREVLRNYCHAGNRMGISSMRAIVGELFGRIGDPEEGLADIDRGLKYVARSGERFAEADLHRVKGELLAMVGKVEEARSSLRDAICVARSQGARSWEMQALVSLAKLHLKQGEHDSAIGLLEPICGWVEAVGSRFDGAAAAQTVLAEVQLHARNGRLDA